jgi:hypothetical protein
VASTGSWYCTNSHVSMPCRRHLCWQVRRRAATTMAKLQSLVQTSAWGVLSTRRTPKTVAASSSAVSAGQVRGAARAEGSRPRRGKAGRMW